jgi:hypothetical protein
MKKIMNSSEAIFCKNDKNIDNPNYKANYLYLMFFINYFQKKLFFCSINDILNLVIGRSNYAL